MIDITFAIRNLMTTLRGSRVLLISVALSAAVLLVLSAVVGQSASKTAAHLARDSAVGAIRLTSSSPSGDAVPLTSAALAEVQSYAHMQAVDTWEQEGLLAEESDMRSESGTPLLLWATPRIPYVQPIENSGPPSSTSPQDDEVLLPDHAGGADLRPFVGTTKKFSYTVATGSASGVDQVVELTVVGTFDNSVPDVDGPTAAYVSQSLMQRLIAARSGLSETGPLPSDRPYPMAFVQADDPAAVGPLQARLSADGFAVSSLASEVDGLPGLVRLLSLVDSAIALLLAAFCLASGVSIASAWLGQRRRDVGLLRALGWRRRRVLRAFILEMIGAGLVTSATGALTGAIVSAASSMALGGREFAGLHFGDSITLPEPAWFVGVVAGIPIAFALGAIGPALSLARVAPDDALRQL